MIARLVAHERWLPAIAAAAWWVTFYPGFFGDDSLINLGEARSGSISVWFTAWWVYVVDALSLGTRAIPLMTLLSALGLEYAVYLWIATVFPRGRARAITVAVIAVTPLVGAIGIQVRHDVTMTSGLLIAAAVLTRTWSKERFSAADVALLVVTAPLIATRHNGLPTIIATAAGCAILRRWRHAGALAAVAAGAALITYGATRAAGHTRGPHDADFASWGGAASVHPMQTVEWLMGDISCALATPGVEPTPDEWAVLTRIARAADWPNARACYVMNPLHTAKSFSVPAVAANYRDLAGVWLWLSLARRYPARIIAAHATRVRLFLPPFAAGMPDTFIISFLHSTILPNDFGLQWAVPAVAERARIVVKAWNAASFVLGNSALWLIVLGVAGYVRTPTFLIGACLNLGLILAAPISEGRYGLFILICGQAAALFWVLERWQQRRA
jgi:hypothetical protein